MSPALLEQVTAVVVAYDSAAVIESCLAALAAEGLPAIVVDNASADETAIIATRMGARLLRNSLNEGYGRANNQGIAACATPLALIVNPDVVLRPGAVAALLAAAERYPGAALLAPRIVEPSGRLFLQPRSLLSPPHLNRASAIGAPEGDCCLPFLSGACLLVRREAFSAVGGFDPDIFLFYEDDDLCRRLREAGHALVHVDGAEAGHGRGRSSAPSLRRRFNARWHMAWSRAHVGNKWRIATPFWGGFLIDLAKVAGYGAILRTEKAAAHAGSAMGALAWWRGRSALARQGLSKISGKDS